MNPLGSQPTLKQLKLLTNQEQSFLWDGVRGAGVGYLNLGVDLILPVIRLHTHASWGMAALETCICPIPESKPMLQFMGVVLGFLIVSLGIGLQFWGKLSVLFRYLWKCHSLLIPLVEALLAFQIPHLHLFQARTKLGIHWLSCS